MGGLLIVACAVIPFLALSQYTAEGLTVLFVTVGCAAIGFTDDYLKLRRRHSLGLPGRWKMVLLAVVTIGVALLLQDTAADETSVYIPLGLGPRSRPLLPVPLPRHRGHRERREPHRRDRRPRRRHGDDHAPHVPRDRRHLVAALRRPATGARSTSTWRRSRRRSSGGRSASSGTTPSPPRSSWATPGRWRSGRDRRVRDRHRHGDPAPAHRGIFVIEVLSLIIQVVSFNGLVAACS